MSSRFIHSAIVAFFTLTPVLLFSQTASGPLTLAQCVEFALKNNSAYLNAERQEAIAGTQVTTARSQILPNISSSFSSNRFEQSASTFKRDVPIIDRETGQTIGYEQKEVEQAGSVRQSHSTSITLNQTIFDFGNTYYGIKQARSGKRAAQYSTENARQNTVLMVHQNYYNLLKNIRLLEVREEAATSSKEQLKRTQSMYEIGSVAQADVYRAQTTYGNDRIALIRQKNLVRDAQALLNTTMGRPVNEALDIVDNEEISTASTYTLEAVLKIAEEKNPQIHSIKADMTSAAYGLKVAKTNYLPSFSGTIRYSRNNSDFDRVYTSYDKNYSISAGVNLSFNIFNGFSDAARVEQESLRKRIAEENLVNTKRDLRRQVQEALLDLDANRQISIINGENLKSAEEDLRLAEERYRVGAGTLLDVIVARSNLTGARSTFVQAKYDTKITEAQLKMAMGVLK